MAPKPRKHKNDLVTPTVCISSCLLLDEQFSKRLRNSLWFNLNLSSQFLSSLTIPLHQYFIEGIVFLSWEIQNVYGVGPFSIQPGAIVISPACHLFLYETSEKALGKFDKKEKAPSVLSSKGRRHKIFPNGCKPPVLPTEHQTTVRNTPNTHAQAHRVLSSLPRVLCSPGWP